MLLLYVNTKVGFLSVLFQGSKKHWFSDIKPQRKFVGKLVKTTLKWIPENFYLVFNTVVCTETVGFSMSFLLCTILRSMSATFCDSSFCFCAIQLKIKCLKKCKNCNNFMPFIKKTG